MAGAAPDFPLDPQQAADAPHTLRIHSPALAFDGGDLEATLAFVGATGIEGLATAVWRWSRADGTESPTVTCTVSGSQVVVPLTGGCGAPAGETPWLECVVPRDRGAAGVAVFSVGRRSRSPTARPTCPAPRSTTTARWT